MKTRSDERSVRHNQKRTNDERKTSTSNAFGAWDSFLDQFHGAGRPAQQFSMARTAARKRTAFECGLRWRPVCCGGRPRFNSGFARRDKLDGPSFWHGCIPQGRRVRIGAIRSRRIEWHDSDLGRWNELDQATFGNFSQPVRYQFRQRAICGGRRSRHGVYLGRRRELELAARRNA